MTTTTKINTPCTCTKSQLHVHFICFHFSFSHSFDHLSFEFLCVRLFPHFLFFIIHKRTFAVFLGSFNFLLLTFSNRTKSKSKEQDLLTDKQNDDALNIVIAIDSSFAIVKAIDDSLQGDDDAAGGGGGGGSAGNATNWKGER